MATLYHTQSQPRFIELTEMKADSDYRFYPGDPVYVNPEQILYFQLTDQNTTRIVFGNLGMIVVQESPREIIGKLSVGIKEWV